MRNDYWCKGLGQTQPKSDAYGEYIKIRDARRAAEKAAKAADDAATRQAALASLQKQYAGSAEAYGKSAAGAQERFQVSLENLQESIGAKLLPVLTRLFVALDRLIVWAEANWPKFQKAAEEAFGSVREAAQKLVDYYNTNFKPAVENVVAAVRAIWERFGAQITTIVATAFAQLVGMCSALVFVSNL